MAFVANMNRHTTRTGVVICLFGILTLCFGQHSPFIEGINANLGDALQFLREYDHEAGNMCYQAKEAQWAFSTNLTEHNKQRMLEEQSLQSKLDRVSWRKAIGFSWSRMPDHLVRRQLRMLTSRTRSALSDSKLNELHNLIQEMKDVYTKARVCPYSSRMSAYCDLSLQPELTRTLAHSRDYEEQLHVWKSWHDAVGPPLHNRYIRYVHLVNEAAQLNGFRDAGHQERAEYEDPGFAQQMSELWLTLSPLYKQLHAYVRRKLYDHYGQRRVRAEGPIPAHILGNMWAQNWKNILDLVIPFPGKRRADVTSEMLRQGYTPTRIFQKAEEFFTSLGLKPMPVEFWHKSMLQRPSDRPVACTASAWDFCNRRDYRIKQCTEVTMDDLLTTHHEMTHIQYYLQYSDQPLLFRDGANPGFHEAVSEAVILSVMTPKHMHRIGLLSNITDDYEASINFLLEMALDKVAYLPFAYLVDQWRWSVFTEGVEGMNARWWSLRLHHQGVIPPVPRGEMDFDPAAKYHIISDQPYIRYFVALVLQFQLHEALCQAAGHIGTLHTCDIYRSREAGRLLSEIMSVGSSRPWPEVLKIATRGRTSRLDATPLLEYFGPLILWLRVQNRDERLVGWSNSTIYTALFEQQQSSTSTEVSNTFSLVLMLCVLNCFFRVYTN